MHLQTGPAIRVVPRPMTTTALPDAGILLIWRLHITPSLPLAHFGPHAAVRYSTTICHVVENLQFVPLLTHLAIF